MTRPTHNPTTIDSLPLFADDMTIGAAILGPRRAGEWKALAPLLEAKGLPKIDALHGGRYTPAVKAFYDRGAGLEAKQPLTADGIEDLGAWKNRKGRA